MRVVLVGPLRSTFVQVDVRILGELGHKVTEVDSLVGYGWRAVVNLVLLQLRLLWSIVKSDAIYCWFADYHTMIPVAFARLLGKKAFVVAGGFDVGYLPEIGYGARCRPIRWFCVKKTFKWATLILPVSQYAKRQLDMLTDGDYAPAEVVYNAVQYDKLPTDIDTQRENLIVTVTQGTSKAEYIRKGTDRFIEAARRNPDVEFVLIGIGGEALKLAERAALGIVNLTIIPGFVSLYDTIIPYYLRARAYMQLSIEETFGVAPVEAMACGCIPIVSDGGALPEVVGSAGYVCRNDAEVDEAVEKVGQSHVSLRLLSHRSYFGQDVRSLALKLTFESVHI